VTIEAGAGMTIYSQRWGNSHSGPMHNHVCAKCLYAWVVRDSACFVSVRALCCIFIVPSYPSPPAIPAGS